NVNAARRGPFGNPVGGPGTSGQIRDGAFTINNLPPGEYSLRGFMPPAFRQGPGGGPAGPPVRPGFSGANVSVNGQDITGVRLAPLTPVTLSGRVVFDDVSAAQSVNASSLRVVVQPVTPDPVPGGAVPQVKDDFTFEIQAMPGLANLRVA